MVLRDFASPTAGVDAEANFKAKGLSQLGVYANL